MIRAIGRWFRSLGYLLTGQVDASRRGLDANPHTVRAKYDKIIEERTRQIGQYKQAISGLMAQHEAKMEKLKTLAAELERLETLKAGALAKARQRVEAFRVQGKDDSVIKQDEDYKKCLAAFNQFEASLKEKQDHAAELEADLGQFQKSIQEHKSQLEHQLKEIKALQSEARETEAEIIAAKQEKEVHEILAGVAGNRYARDLQELRQLRQELKAEAKITRDLSGAGERVKEEEFLKFAQESMANTEFDKLVGLAGQADAGAEPAEADTHKETARDARLPE